MSFELDSSNDDLQIPLAPESTDADADIASLEQQIGEMSSYLESLRTHSSDRQRRHSQKIDKLAKQIDLSQAAFSRYISDQRAIHQRELQELAESQRAELDEIILGARRMNMTTERWNELVSSLRELSERMEMIDLEKRINRTQNEGIEFEMTRTHSAEERSMRTKDSIEAQQRRVNLLEDEIRRYMSLARQEENEFNQMSSECTQAQENREKCHMLTVSRLNEEAAHRDQIFEQHLAVIQRQLEREKQKAEIDSNSMKETEKSLLDLKRLMSQRSLKQISAAMKDIKLIQRLIEDNAENEESSTKMTLSSVSKAQSIERDNALLKQKIDAIQKQVGNLQSDIMKGSLELKRTKTPTKDSNKGFRSTFY